MVRVIDAGSAGRAVQFVRRARGYAPLPVAIDARARPAGTAVEPAGAERAQSVGGPASVVLAVGPEQKNTFALLRGDEAFVSQHVGDMENALTYDAWLAAKRRFEKLFEATPSVVACDLHPEYLTSKWAHEQDLPSSKCSIITPTSRR